MSRGVVNGRREQEEGDDRFLGGSVSLGDVPEQLSRTYMVRGSIRWYRSIQSVGDIGCGEVVWTVAVCRIHDPIRPRRGAFET